MQGRFDMRAMQAATAASMADKFNESPMEGDGYTYEQFADRDELWFDFCADTGDGGNSTYTGAQRPCYCNHLPSPVQPMGQQTRRRRKPRGVP